MQNLADGKAQGVAKLAPIQQQRQQEEEFSMLMMSSANFFCNYTHNGRRECIYVKAQLQVLEYRFHQRQYPDVNTRKELAASLGLGERDVQMWFKNRRAMFSRIPTPISKMENLADGKAQDFANLEPIQQQLGSLSLQNEEVKQPFTFTAARESQGGSGTSQQQQQLQVVQPPSASTGARHCDQPADGQQLLPEHPPFGSFQAASALNSARRQTPFGDHYNVGLKTMRVMRGLDLDRFLVLPAEERQNFIEQMNEDMNKLISELVSDDPLAETLKDELRMANEHFHDLVARAQKTAPAPEKPDLSSSQFEEASAELMRKFEEWWMQLNHQLNENLASNMEQLERQIHEHKTFEAVLQTMDMDVSKVKEQYRQLSSPKSTQSQAAYYNMVDHWVCSRDLSRMYGEYLKALKPVLGGMEEVKDIVGRHEISLASFDDLPAEMEQLQRVHAQLQELDNLLEQQRQKNIVRKLNEDTATLRQLVVRARIQASNHPDMDEIEAKVSQVAVRWDTVNGQVAERLRIVEEAKQSQMEYRNMYSEELEWFDQMESNIIGNLRRPEELDPEGLLGQLDELFTEYAQLQEHKATIESINKEGAKFVQDAKSYNIRLGQYHDRVVNIHSLEANSQIRQQQQVPPQSSKTVDKIIADELELLKRRFAELSSMILERRNAMMNMAQNLRHMQQQQQMNGTTGESQQGQVPPTTTQPSQDSADKQRLIRQQLVLLLHAHKCQQREEHGSQQESGNRVPCTFHYCQVMKSVLTHMVFCTAGRQCQYPHCASSRLIINHWKNCEKEDCPICHPVRKYLDGESGEPIPDNSSDLPLSVVEQSQNNNNNKLEQEVQEEKEGVQQVQQQVMEVGEQPQEAEDEQTNMQMEEGAADSSDSSSSWCYVAI